jgi:hypothetical protein
MQFKRQRQALLAGHAPVTLDLFILCALRIHWSVRGTISKNARKV